MTASVRHTVDGAEPLRVLYLSWRDTGHPEAGGAEIFAERTARVLHERGNQVTIFTSHYPGASRTDDHDGVRIVRGGGRYDCYWQGLRYARRHRADFDVVLDVQNGVPFWAPLARTAPVVNLTHHSHRDQWRAIFGPVLGRAGWLLESRVAPLVYRRSTYVTVSHASRHDLVSLGVSEDRIDIVYNGLDEPPVPVDPAGRGSAHPRLVVLSRLVPHKQIELAIDAVAQLRERHPGLTLDIVGTGYWHDRLVEHAKRAGVLGWVSFHGFVDEVTKHRLLQQAWVMLMPSEKEGWGLTILEAAQHGVPSVGLRAAGGPTESILHGTTGLLADDAAQFLAHTDELLRREGLRRALGHGARTYAGRFDWRTAGLSLERTLRRAAGRALEEQPVAASADEAGLSRVEPAESAPSVPREEVPA